MSIELPDKGFVFWPVGTGDSTTISIDEYTVIQVDLNHMAKANDEEDPHASIVDELVQILPKINGKPYLSVFALTHPDQDHCRGFSDLLSKVKIGQIWHTPRVFREYSKDLCDDATAFQKEAKRRIKKMISEKGKAKAGDRLRLIGYDDLLKEDNYKGFPEEYLTVPGNGITSVDDMDKSTVFRAFVHAPFKDDSSGERNAASLGLQVTLMESEKTGRAMLLGDHCYPTVKRIFDKSDENDLKWNIFLAPHHCSKKVMYWQGEGEDEEKLKQDILDQIEEASEDPGYIISSSEPIPGTNSPGDNPPHAKAKNRYSEIAPDDFICTQEHPDKKSPEPVIFELSPDGFTYMEKSKGKSDTRKSLAAAVETARGGENPKERVGFGKWV